MKKNSGKFRRLGFKFRCYLYQNRQETCFGDVSIPQSLAQIQLAAKLRPNKIVLWWARSPLRTNGNQSKLLKSMKISENSEKSMITIKIRYFHGVVCHSTGFPVTSRGPRVGSRSFSLRLIDFSYVFS